MSENSQRKQITGRAIPLPGNEIDTDRIIPARFMKCVTFDGLGQYAFHDARFNEDGSDKPHPFNDTRYSGANILVTGANFGCGSSREHAPQALLRYGITGIIAESFAEIFAGNCTALGVPAAVVSHDAVEALMKEIESNPGTEVVIDLVAREVRAGSLCFPAVFKDTYRNVLISGEWDTTSQLLSAGEAIDRKAQAIPYVSGFRGNV